MKILLKYIFTTLFFTLMMLPVQGQRKKVGVVLSGGGAKGVAHIGVLKVIEEAGIPIDYITGTSMGAIIGGLYAAGYDLETLDSMVRSQDWTTLLSDKVSRDNLSFTAKENREKYILTVPLTDKKKLTIPTGLVGGNNVYNLLTELTIGYHDSISFKDDLPIPFACVAYDMVTGQSIVLDHGNLPLSIRASMSIPGAFEPVRIDSMVLIDGGITNNFPADVIKSMGAEIVIGADVGAGPRTAEEIKSLGDMFNQITYFTGVESYEKNKELIDVYIHPDIVPYTAASFSAAAIDTLLVRGYVGAREKWDELIEVKDRIGIPRDYKVEERPRIDIHKAIQLRHIKFEGLEYQKEKTLRRVCGLKEYSIVHAADLQNATSLLQGMGTLSEVNYQLEGTSPYDLVFKVKESTRNSISVGLRFDTEEMAAILLNVSLAFSQMSNSHFDITGRLSENPYAKASYILGNETERQVSLSYMYKYNGLNLYNRGSKLSNIDFNHHTVDLNFSNIQVRNFKVALGIKYNYYDFSSTLSQRDVDLNPQSEGLFNYYLTAQYESLDRRYNPRKGVSLQAGYTLYTSDLVTYNGNNPFSAINFNFLTALSVSKRIAFLPGIFGRVLIGKDIPLQAQNLMGGTVAGRYLPQQIPFVGIHRFEKFDNTVIGAKLDFRVRLWVKNFISLKTNFAKEVNTFFDLLDGSDVWGVGLAYSYNTIIGPLDFQVDYSNRTEKVGVYFNLGYYF